MKINFYTISEDDFRELERQAWNGTLDYRKFPAPEFKFFATIEYLGYRHRHDKIPVDLLKDDIDAARKIYHNEHLIVQKSLETYRAYQDAIINADKLRIAINKAHGQDKLLLALECIELLTGEKGFAKRNLKEE